MIETWDYNCAIPPPADSGAWPGPVPDPQGARLNLWLVGGAPSNGQPVEVVISKLTYIPATF